MEDDCKRAQGAGQPGPARYVWGHPVRHLELHAWHWLEAALQRRPERAPGLLRLMRRLDEATFALEAPESSSTLWVVEPQVDATVVRALDEIVAVMRDIAELLNEEASAPRSK